MKVRLATLDDWESISRFCGEYSGDQLKDYDTAYNATITRETVKVLIGQNNVYVCDDLGIIGAIAGTTVACHFTKDILFSSLLFYVQPEQRHRTKKFIKLLGDTLRSRGVTKLIICNPEANNGEQMDRFYNMIGFKKLETHYLRNLC